MQKPCKCGRHMTLQLRTVIYKDKLEIENVPIFTCDVCQHSELWMGIRDSLTQIIHDHQDAPETKRLRFNEWNELAALMYNIAKNNSDFQEVESIIEERINELLDLLILARSLQKPDWAAEIQNRLKQVTNYISMALK